MPHTRHPYAPELRAQSDALARSDITYISTSTGFLYPVVVPDAYSRRIVGWAAPTHLRTELVLDVFAMAIAQRRPVDVIHHSDQRSQHASVAFGQRCRHAGVCPSLDSVNDCYDSAICESFLATQECELY